MNALVEAASAVAAVAVQAGEKAAHSSEMADFFRVVGKEEVFNSNVNNDAAVVVASFSEADVDNALKSQPELQLVSAPSSTPPRLCSNNRLRHPSLYQKRGFLINFTSKDSLQNVISIGCIRTDVENRYEIADYLDTYERKLARIGLSFLSEHLLRVDSLANLRGPLHPDDVTITFSVATKKSLENGVDQGIWTIDCPSLTSPLFLGYNPHMEQKWAFLINAQLNTRKGLLTRKASKRIRQRHSKYFKGIGHQIVFPDIPSMGDDPAIPRGQPPAAEIAAGAGQTVVPVAKSGKAAGELLPQSVGSSDEEGLYTDVSSDEEIQDEKQSDHCGKRPSTRPSSVRPASQPSRGHRSQDRHQSRGTSKSGKHRSRSPFSGSGKLYVESDVPHQRVRHREDSKKKAPKKQGKPYKGRDKPSPYAKPSAVQRRDRYTGSGGAART